MNNLIENIHAALLKDQRVVLDSFPSTITERYVVEAPHELGYRYEIKSVFEMKGYCRDQSELNNLIDTFIRALRDDLYREIRSDVRRLQKAIYDRDFFQARDILRNVNLIVDGK